MRAFVDTAIEDAANQFNVEYRVSDATASPYMGTRRHRARKRERNPQRHEAPKTVVCHDLGNDGSAAQRGQNFDVASVAERSACSAGRQSGCARLARVGVVRSAFVRLKKSEIAAVEGLSEESICSRYATAY